MKELLFGLALLALYFAVLGWNLVIRRLWSGQEVLPYEPRRPVPWNGTWVLWTVVVYLGLFASAGHLAGKAYFADLTDAERAAAQNDQGATQSASPGFVLKMIQADSASKLFTVFFVTLALIQFRNVNADDLGISFKRFPRRAAEGVFAFFVIVPPVMLLQAGIVEGLGIKYEHPLINLIQQAGNQSIIVWSSFAAMIVAPLVEEFLFRGLLQGWLERAVNPLAEPADFYDERTIELAQEPPATAPQKPSPVPIFVSSLMFAAVHLEQWPAPIPLFILALGLGYLYRQTHSIWPGVVVHFMLNGLTMSMLLLERK